MQKLLIKIVIALILSVLITNAVNIVYEKTLNVGIVMVMSILMVTLINLTWEKE